MKFFLLLLSILLITAKTHSQTDTTFWFAAPDVSVAFNYDRPIHFRISSLRQPCIVTVSQPAGGGFPTQTFAMAANTTQSVDLSNWITSIECAPGNVVQNKGLKIVSSSKIAVYYEVNANGPNAELFSLKGKNALGMQFFVSSQYLLNNTTVLSPTPISSFNIVATEDNTLVTITPAKAIVGHVANLPFTITMNTGQTYAAIATSTLASQHLHGSKIGSTKPVAVTLSDYLGDGGPAYGGVCQDLAGDQTVPVSIVGNEYIAFKSNLNNPFDKVYVLATQNNTTVNQDGIFVTSLNSGQSAELTVANPTTYAQLSAPGYAYQLSGVGCEAGSAILPKINCTGSSTVSIVKSTNENFIVTLLVKSGGQGSFLVNNTSGIINAGQFSVVPATGGLWYGAKVTLPLSGFPNGSIIKVSNTTNIFQMGVLQGGIMSGVGFGYFSDFNSLQANAIVPFPNLCVGSGIQLIADTIVSGTYTWTGSNNFSSNLQNPFTNNAGFVNSGDYILNVSVPGCGSFYDTVNIIVKPKSFSIINQSICQGQAYYGYTSKGTYIDTFIGTNGCDSVRTVNLGVKPNAFSTISQTICQGQAYLGYSSNGIYTRTLVASNGCDSIRTLTLKVKPRSFTTISQSICEGQSYLGYNSSGVYINTLLAANGCDSIRTLNLVVKPKSFTTINQSICNGQSYLGYNSTGTYKDTLITANGCDSIRTVNLTVKPNASATVNQFICQGKTYMGYSNSGAYIDTLIAANGCDSIRTLNLTVNAKSFATLNQFICQGKTYLGYSSSGTYTNTSVSSNGSDSISTLNLIVNPSPVITISQAICEGQSYLGYSNNAIYKDTFVTASGCDSIRTINLTVNKNPKPDLGANHYLCA